MFRGKRDLMVGDKKGEESYKRSDKVWLIGDSHLKNIHFTMEGVSIMSISGGRLEHVRWNLLEYQSLEQFDTIFILAGGNDLSRSMNAVEVCRNLEKLVGWIGTRFPHLVIATRTILPRDQNNFVEASLFIDRRIVQVLPHHHHFMHKLFINRGHHRVWGIRKVFFREDGMHMLPRGYDGMVKVFMWAIEAIWLEDFLSSFYLDLYEDGKREVVWKF